MAPKHSKLDVLQSASPSEQSSSHEDEEEDSHLTPQPHSESESEPEPEPVARVAKRPAETRAGRRESKKGKVDVVVQKPAVRVWSEEEEISILKGMMKIGPNACSDMEAFHGLVKKSLQAEASRNQLYDKVRRLKRKYFDNVERVKNDESVSSSWRTHEKKLFDLSRTIWGGEDNVMLSPKSEKTRSARIPKEPEISATPLLDVESYVTGKGLDLIQGPERAELEERWASLHKAQLKVFVERTKLILDQAKLVLAAHK